MALVGSNQSIAFEAKPSREFLYDFPSSLRNPGFPKKLFEISVFARLHKYPVVIVKRFALIGRKEANWLVVVSIVLSEILVNLLGILEPGKPKMTPVHLHEILFVVAYLLRRSGNREDAAVSPAMAWIGCVVAVAIILMKVVPSVPGSFTRPEWIAFAGWSGFGLVFWLLRPRPA